MVAASRTVRHRRTIKVGEKKYLVGKKATRSVVKDAGVKTVSLAKKAGGSVVKTLTGGADAAGATNKNLRLGAYARANKVVNEDGSTTYTKKGGGTVTKALSIVDAPKSKRRRRS